MRTLVVVQLRRLRRSLGRQGAIDNAASVLAEHARIFGEIDDLARRLPTVAVAPEQAA